jgi:signal transduction histidine kinase/CheY-like chemotaxis protein
MVGLGALAAIPFYADWLALLFLSSVSGFLIAGAPVSVYARFGSALTGLLALAGWCTAAVASLGLPPVALMGATTLLAMAVPMRDIPRGGFVLFTVPLALGIGWYAGTPWTLLETALLVGAATAGWVLGYQIDRQLRDSLIHWSHERSAAAVAQEFASRAQEAEAQASRLIEQERWATLGRVAIGVGHEIKNPLQAVLSSIQFARTTGDLDVLADAELAAERIKSVVDDLGHFRGRPGESEVRRHNLKPLLEETVRQARIGLAQTTVQFGMVPDLSIEANPARLTQVLANLFTNAWHASERRGSVRIRIHAYKVDESVEIHIDDDGPGIPDSALERVFEVFLTTKPAGKGTGLGLPISRAIAQSMGGKLIARTGSTLGGARLTLTFPAFPATEAPAALPAENPAPSPATSESPPVRPSSLPAIHRRPPRPDPAEPAANDQERRGGLLIIEDNAVVRRVISRMLQDTWDVHQADGTREARSILRKQQIDVVLCDLHLQQEDALDVMELIAGLERRLVDRVVFMTGQATSSRLVALVSANPDRQLEKPFDRAKGERLLREAWAGRLPALELPSDYSSAESMAVLEPAWTYDSPTEEIQMRRTQGQGAKPVT